MIRQPIAAGFFF
ncbi:SAM-dependent methyltransferase, partial [Vibrio cholerae CP1047(20)]